MSFGICASLEAREEEERREQYRDTDVENLVETTALETELVENAETEAELDRRELEMDVAEDAAESLESLIDTLTIAVENGGLDRNGAMLLNNARENVYARFGLSYPESRWASLESFGGESSRRSATVIALEEDQGRFKQIMATIWKAIKEYAKKVVDFITSWVTATGRTKRRAEAIKSKAPEAKFGGKLTEEQQKRYGKFFYANGKTNNVYEAMNEVASVTNNMKEEAWATKMLSIMEKIEKGIDPSVPDKKSLWGKIKDIFAFFKPENIDQIAKSFDPGIKKRPEIKAMWNKGDKGDYYAGTTISGGRALCFYYGFKEGASEEDKLPVMIVDFAPVEKLPETAKYTDAMLPLNTGHVVNVCDKVIDICNARDRVNASLKKFADAARKSTDSMEKKSGSLKEKAQSAGRELAAFFRNLFNSVAKPFLALAKYCVTISKSALDVCTLAMKGGKEDKKDDGE